MKFSDDKRGPYTRDAPFSSSDELYHFGTKGMKWGIRRYQNEDGSLTDEGRTHYGYGAKRLTESLKARHQAKVAIRKKKKQDKQRAKNLEAARKARLEKAEYNKAKKKALETGDADEVYKYVKDLTPQERFEVQQRLQAEDNLSRLAGNAAARRAEEAARNSKWNKAMNVTKKAGDVATSIENMSKMYNAAAKVINTFSDDKLKIIGEKSENTKKTEVNYMADHIMQKYYDMPVSKFMAMDSKTIVNEATKLKQLEEIEKRKTK